MSSRKTRSFSFETRTRRPPANRMKALILADRVIFALVNRGEIGPWGFRGGAGRDLFAGAGDAAVYRGLRETVMHKGLGWKVSYRRLIRFLM